MKRAVVVLLLLIANAIVSTSKMQRAEAPRRETEVAQVSNLPPESSSEWEGLRRPMSATSRSACTLPGSAPAPGAVFGALAKNICKRIDFFASTERASVPRGAHDTAGGAPALPDPSRAFSP